MAYVDTYYVTAKGGTEEAEEVVARRMAAGDHVHTWSLETGTLCMQQRPECEKKVATEKRS